MKSTTNRKSGMRHNATLNRVTAQIRVEKNEAAQHYEAYVYAGRYFLYGPVVGQSELEARRALGELQQTPLAKALIGTKALPRNVAEALALGILRETSPERGSRTVTASEVAALAHRLHDHAKKLRSLIHDADRDALFLLLHANPDPVIAALDRMAEPDARLRELGYVPRASKRGDIERGSRAELILRAIVVTWQQIMGEVPAATRAFNRLVVATFRHFGEPLPKNPSRTIRNGLAKLRSSSPSLLNLR